MIEDIEKDPRFARINRQKYESKSLISVPLIYKDQIFGVINLNNKLDGKSFTQDDLSMLVSIGLPAAVAIDRVNIIAEKTRTINELTVLHRLAEKVSMLDDPAKIGQATYEGLKQLFNIEFILWYDYYERGSRLQLEYYFGNLPQNSLPLSVRAIDLAHESVTLGDESNIQVMEETLAENIRGFVGGENIQIIPISIFLKRALAGVAVLAFPLDFQFEPLYGS